MNPLRSAIEPPIAFPIAGAFDDSGMGGGAAPNPDAAILSFGALGDSITRNMYTLSTAWASDVGEVLNYTGRAWAAWACQRSGRRAFADIDAFEGYSGYRTDQILAAMLPANNTRTIGVAGNTAEIPYGVLARSPDYCFVMAGTNDLSQGVALSTAVINLRAIWSTLKAAGIKPVAISLLPRDAPADFAADVPTWNAAIEAAAITDNVPFIDVYTSCNNGSGGFKTGWTYIGGSADPTGLHPGNEACHAMAEDIAAALATILPSPTYTPYVDSAMTCTLVKPSGGEQLPLHSDLGGGLFPSATGWGPRYEVNGTSTVAVSGVTPAEIGNALTIAFPAPSGGGGYSDRAGPGTYAVTPGKRYALLARIQFDAGHNEDSVAFGVGGNTGGYATLWIITSGGDQGVCSTPAGASFTERDIYHEFVVPPGITTARPWISQKTSDGSTGSTVRIAQLGLLALA